MIQGSSDELLSQVSVSKPVKALALVVWGSGRSLMNQRRPLEVCWLFCFLIQNQQDSMELPMGFGVSLKFKSMLCYLQHAWSCVNKSPSASVFETVSSTCVCVCVCAQLCQILCNLMDYSPPGSSVHGIFWARIEKCKSTWVGCHFLLQETFPTQGLNQGVPHCRQTLYRLSHQGSPSEKVIVNFSAFNSTYLFSLQESGFLIHYIEAIMHLMDVKPNT